MSAGFASAGIRVPRFQTKIGAVSAPNGARLTSDGSITDGRGGWLGLSIGGRDAAAPSTDASARGGVAMAHNL
jgi:hypothetical protein